MRDGDLAEPDLVRERLRGELVLRKSNPMQQHDRDAVEPSSVRGLEIGAQLRRSERLEHVAMRVDTLEAPITRTYSICGSAMSSAKMSGRCWPPMRIASSSPAVITSAGFAAPLSRAFVATVVPILTAAMRRSAAGTAASTRSMPATAASS